MLPRDNWGEEGGRVTESDKTASRSPVRGDSTEDDAAMLSTDTAAEGTQR